MPSPESQIPYPQKAREKIAASKALDKLIKALNGEIELTPVQANIGLSLLKKVVPDQKAVEQKVSGELDHTHSVDKQSVEQAVEVIRAEMDRLRA